MRPDSRFSDACASSTRWRWPGIGESYGAEHLEGDLALELQVLGQIDGGHTAPAELTLDAVLFTESSLELVQR